MKRLAVALAIVAAVLPFANAFAIGQPDTLTVNSVQCYPSAIQSGDLVCVSDYTVGYDSIPTDYTVTQAYIGRFMAGAIELNSVAPVTYTGTVAVLTAAPYKGYGEGVMSWYWTAAQVAAQGIVPGCTTCGYNVILQGNPSVFTATVPSVNYSSIQWEAAANLPADVLAIAATIQADWSGNTIALLQAIQGITVLTSNGQTYFVAAIPNLATMAPSIFTAQTTSPILISQTVTPNTSNGYDAFWQGTALQDFWPLNSFRTRMMISVFFTVATLVSTALVFGGVQYGIWSAAVVFTLCTAIGFGPMAGVATAVLVAAVVLAYEKLRG